MTYLCRKANHQSDLVEPPSETTATEKKRKKKQKLKSKRASGGGNDIVVEKSEENVCTEDKDSLPSDNVGTETALAEDQKEVKNEKKMKQKKKNKNKANDIETNGMVEEAKQNSQSSSKSKARTYGNGLAVEELSMGKPDGKRASRGSKVSLATPKLSTILFFKSCCTHHLCLSCRFLFAILVS